MKAGLDNFLQRYSKNERDSSQLKFGCNQEINYIQTLRRIDEKKGLFNRQRHANLTNMIQE